MAGPMLPVEDWDTLANLGLGTSVLQLGFTDGIDTATLARSSNFVLAAGHERGDPRDDPGDSFASWHRMVDASGVAHKVLGSLMPWEAVVSLWGPRAFGLVVLNFTALGANPPMGALNLAFAVGRTVAVIDVPEMDLEQPIKDVAGYCGFTVFRSGRLWVARSATPATHTMTAGV